MKGDVTHAMLVEAAKRWLVRRQNCGVVLLELQTGGCRAVPDAIGWRFCGQQSVLVECKVSRSDFLRDKNKSHRKTKMQLGLYRFYMTPPGLIKPEEIPPGWGLVEYDGKCFTQILDSTRNADCHMRAEVGLLYSAALRWASENVSMHPSPECDECLAFSESDSENV